MAKKKFEGAKARTPTFRACFLNVFQPKAFKDDQGNEGKEKYSVQMLFDKEAVDLTDLKKKMKGVAVKAWGKDEKKWPKNFSWPFNDGDDMPEDMDDAQKEIYAGMVYCNADSIQPPGIYGANPKDSSDDPTPQDLFSGCYCQASLFMVPYQDIGGRGNKGRSGIKLYLQGIQLIEKGERLGSGASRDDFEAVENEDGDSDSSDDDDDGPGF
jgi:hypothetical protein